MDALMVAWVLATVILMLSSGRAALSHRGLLACERLMGMVLTVVSVPMFLDGVRLFLSSRP